MPSFDRHQDCDLKFFYRKDRWVTALCAYIVIGPNKAQTSSTLEASGYKAPVFHLEERVDANRWLFIVTLCGEARSSQKLDDDVAITGQPANLHTVSRGERDAALKVFGS